MSAPTYETVEAVKIPHTRTEDALGLVTGLFTASLGLYLVKASAAATGGTAGLSLLLSYWSPVPFEVLFVLVNLPFFALAVWKKGWVFTLKSLLCVIAVSLLTTMHAALLPISDIDRAYGAVGGNLLAGVGLLILFRHGASLGGFNIACLLIQDTLGWRAGYVQMGLDVIVVLCAFVVVDLPTMLLSALGAVVLNIVLAFNHRPGRYLA